MLNIFEVCYQKQIMEIIGKRKTSHGLVFRKKGGAFPHHFDFYSFPVIHESWFCFIFNVLLHSTALWNTALETTWYPQVSLTYPSLNTILFSNKILQSPFQETKYNCLTILRSVENRSISLFWWARERRKNKRRKNDSILQFSDLNISLDLHFPQWHPPPGFLPRPNSPSLPALLPNSTLSSNTPTPLWKQHSLSMLLDTHIIRVGRPKLHLTALSVLFILYPVSSQVLLIF